MGLPPKNLYSNSTKGKKTTTTFNSLSAAVSYCSELLLFVFPDIVSAERRGQLAGAGLRDSPGQAGKPAPSKRPCG